MLTGIYKLTSCLVAGIGVGIGLAVTNSTFGRYMAARDAKKVLEDLGKNTEEAK